MRRTLAVVLLAACCLAATAGLAGGVHDESTEDTLAIELTADGDAEVHHITAYNLSTDEERSAYESVANNDTARAEHREETMSDLEAAAATGRNGSELDMRVRDPTVETYQRNGTGFVSVTVTWENLAYHNETLVAVTEPFRSGYEPDRDVTIHGPEGYRRGVTQPSPSIARLNSAAWSVEVADFSNFYANFQRQSTATESAATATPAPDDEGLVGVGVFVRAFALAALPVIGLLLALQRRE